MNQTNPPMRKITIFLSSSQSEIHDCLRHLGSRHLTVRESVFCRCGGALVARAVGRLVRAAITLKNACMHSPR